VLDASGKPVTVLTKLECPKLFHAVVFNASQINGIPPLEKRALEWDPHERAENILNTSGAKITNSPFSKAFYNPHTDSIHLPSKGQFPSVNGYYSTAFHELGHWTGHASRLNRDLSDKYGTPGYAREELRAEISALLIGGKIGVGHQPRDSAAYVGSWIKALKDDPLEIFRAAADADKIQKFVLAYDLTRERSQFQEQKLPLIDRCLNQLRAADVGQPGRALDKSLCR
jgi:antirestriction protein ArdC